MILSTSSRREIGVCPGGIFFNDLSCCPEASAQLIKIKHSVRWRVDKRRNWLFYKIDVNFYIGYGSAHANKMDTF